MELIKFEDYISIYSDILSRDWVTLYEHGNEITNEIKNDIFTFCALLDNDEQYIKDYLRNFNWGFSPNSFGHSYFEQTSHNIGNGQFKDEIYFVVGNIKKQS